MFCSCQAVFQHLAKHKHQTVQKQLNTTLFKCKYDHWVFSWYRSWLMHYINFTISYYYGHSALEKCNLPTLLCM